MVFSFGLVHVTPPPPHLGSYTRELLVSQDRRHLFVTPLSVSLSHTLILSPYVDLLTEVGIM
jgi:hypothetical protein